VARLVQKAKATGHKILIVDDVEEVVLSTRALLERDGHDIRTSLSGPEAVQIALEWQPHLMIVDYFMPEMTGEEVIRLVRARTSQMQILLHTGYASEKPPRDMLQKLEIQGYHDKSEGPEKLLVWVDAALKAYEHLENLVRAHQEAQQLRDEARASELEARATESRREAMASFVKIASHDLKGPLSVIQTSVSLLHLALATDPENMVLVSYIETAVQRARTLIDTYLQASEIDSGQPLRIRRVPVNPQAMFEEEMHLVSQAVAEERTEPFEFVNEVTCTQLDADVDKLRQIMANLLSNACKYSPQGGVVRASSRDEGDKVVFSVSDSGVGISPDDQEKLFGQFQRVGNTAIATGTGLGLWLVAALVKGHGGEIRVTSEPGQGSTFHFSIARTSNG
jgi:signal transduction histidine kinase